MIKHHIAHLQSIVNNKGNDVLSCTAVHDNNMGYSHLQSIVNRQGRIPCYLCTAVHDKTSYSPAVYCK